MGWRRGFFLGFRIWLGPPSVLPGGKFARWIALESAVNTQQPRDLLPAVLIAIFLVSAAILAAFYFYAMPQPGTFRLEIAKAILQVGVVSVVGAVVSVFVFEYQRRRQQSDRDREYTRTQVEQQQERERKRIEYREDLLKTTLAKAVTSYNSVKKSRRFLRARATTVQNSVDRVIVAPYDTYLEAINDAQLEFENLKGDVRTSKPAFSSPGELFEAFETMEKFLGKLIKEYEDDRPHFHSDNPTRELGAFTVLCSFLVGPYEGSDFEEKFVKPYHKVQELIRKDLLYPQLPKTRDGS